MSKIDFGKRFEEFVISRGYFLKSPYIKSNIKVSLTCNNGHDFLMSPNDFKSGIGCPKCSRKCPEQAKAEFEQLVITRGYLLKSPYVKAMSKVSLTCNNGHDFLTSPNSFKSGQGCPKCSGNCPEQTKKEFEQLVITRGYLLKSPYVKAMSKVSLTCSNGHDFLMNPSNFKSGQGCPKCAGLCPEQAKEEFEQLVTARGHLLKSPYISSLKKVNLTCSNGHHFLMSPSDFKRGYGCPKCAGLCPEQAKKEFEELVMSRGHILKSPYVKNSLKVSLTCNNGHDFLMSPNSFKSGQGCPKCSGNCPEQAKKEFEELVISRGHFLKSPYITNKVKVSLTCNNGHDFLMNPSNFKSGRGCPICATNHGIKSLYILRDKNNPEIAKIGVSLHPWRRCELIQQSAEDTFKDKHNFEIYTQWDLSFEMHKAVDTETFILQKFSDKKFYGAEKVFDGSSEILSISPEELEREVIDFWK